ncbi:MAG: electron transport complex subunit RsxB [Pseudomonadota bacterium]
MNATDKSTLFSRIYAALPQTQCTRCGYRDCAAYAQAVAGGEAAINQCPPGGAEGVERLAAITGQPALPLNPANGSEGPRSVAVIDEAWCIGCTLCLPVCPTDAILGSNKMMHTVIEPYCTGCELCIPVCPVDCISLENVTGERTGWAAWSGADAALAQNRYEIHSLRRTSGKGQGPKKPQNPEKTSAAAPAEHPANPDAGKNGQERKRSIIEAALAQAKARRGSSKP